MENHENALVKVLPGKWNKIGADATKNVFL